MIVVTTSIVDEYLKTDDVVDVVTVELRLFCLLIRGWVVRERAVDAGEDLIQLSLKYKGRHQSILTLKV